MEAKRGAKRKMSDTFKYRVQRKLEKDGYRVYQIKDSRCSFDMLSINPEGSVAGVKIKQHGHLTQEERKQLLWYKIPIYIGREAYGIDRVHEIKVEKIK